MMLQGQAVPGLGATHAGRRRHAPRLV